MDAVIRFTAAIYKVQTLVDGGIRLTLDMDENAIPQMAMLAEVKRNGIPLEFVAKISDYLGVDMNYGRPQ